MKNQDNLTAAELFERERAGLPQMVILDARQQYSKELARYILDLAPAPEGDQTVDDLFATFDHILARLGPACFSTQKNEDRAVEWVSSLRPDIKVAFLTRLKPLVGETNAGVINSFFVSFWK